MLTLIDREPRELHVTHEERVKELLDLNECLIKLVTQLMMPANPSLHEWFNTLKQQSAITRQELETH